MAKTNVEYLFEWLDETAIEVQEHQDETYLDSLAIVLETIFYNKPDEEWDDRLQKKLRKRLQKIHLEKYSEEDVRKSLQLVVLKGMQKSTQQNHMITPETVALLMGYLAQKLTNEEKGLRVFDPVCGTGNLLTTVLSHLPSPGQSFGSEIDPTLIKLAWGSANLQKMTIEFFHQDSLQPFLLDPVDLVVADLPVGYYPDDERAKNFELRAEEGHSYAHHLLIEQSLYYTKERGYLLMLVPEFIFDSDQSKQLHKFLHQHAHIVGLIRLPESAFASRQNMKSILILQKQGPDTETPNPPLLVDFPSFSETEAVADILQKINTWFMQYKQNNGE